MDEDTPRRWPPQLPAGEQAGDAPEGAVDEPRGRPPWPSPLWSAASTLPGAPGAIGPSTVEPAEDVASEDRPVDAPRPGRSSAVVNAFAVLGVLGVAAITIILLATNGESEHTRTAADGVTTTRPHPEPTSTPAEVAPRGARLAASKGAPATRCSQAPDCHLLHLRWEGFGNGAHEAVCRIRGRTETLTTTIVGARGERDINCYAWPGALNVVYVTVDNVEAVVTEW